MITNMKIKSLVSQFKWPIKVNSDDIIIKKNMKNEWEQEQSLPGILENMQKTVTNLSNII